MIILIVLILFFASLIVLTRYANAKEKKNKVLIEHSDIWVKTGNLHDQIAKLADKNTSDHSDIVVFDELFLETIHNALQSCPSNQHQKHQRLFELLSEFETELNAHIKDPKNTYWKQMIFKWKTITI